MSVSSAEAPIALHRASGEQHLDREQPPRCSLEPIGAQWKVPISNVA